MRDEGLFAELARFFRAASTFGADVRNAENCSDCRKRRSPSGALRLAIGSFNSSGNRGSSLSGLNLSISRNPNFVRSRENDIRDRECDVQSRERRLESTARALAKDMLKSDATVRALIKEAKQQALQRSRSTLLGKLFERLGPFFQTFGHDPRDMRAIMDPIDYVVFNGLTMNRCVDYITFVEVKAGLGRQSPCQRSIAETIRRGNFEIQTWQIGDRDLPLAHQLLRAPAATPKTQQVERGGTLSARRSHGSRFSTL